jgi:hypothetical protein
MTQLAPPRFPKFAEQSLIKTASASAKIIRFCQSDEQRVLRARELAPWVNSFRIVASANGTMFAARVSAGAVIGSQFASAGHKVAYLDHLW